MLDPIEQEYERRIARAGDTDEAYELAVALRQYQSFLRVEDELYEIMEDDCGEGGPF